MTTKVTIKNRSPDKQVLIRTAYPDPDTPGDHILGTEASVLDAGEEIDLHIWSDRVLQIEER